MQRPSALPEHQQFDLLICGGGIYGAWTAYDAALRGLKVIIVDQGDWASGTSSASSKLIHGGLRYLETLDFGLVKKSLRERQRLIDAAPYRIWPLRFSVPVNKHSRIGSLRLKIGLLIYDFLAGTYQSQYAHQHMSAEQFARCFPSLDATDLNCGYTYWDAQTDDARLVLEIIDGACNAGAVCLNYCQASEIIEQKGSITGAVLSDKITGANYTIKTSVVVNASGQWLSESSSGKQWCRLSKGVHLILPKRPENDAMLLTAQSDGRVFFIIPWYGKTLVGTTDTDYKGDVNRVSVAQQDIDYLLNEANLALAAHWTEHDIQGQFAGLRVMQNSAKKMPSQVSRDWQLKTIKKGLFYAIGGKLTSSREDAAQIVDAVCKHLDQKLKCTTDVASWPWLPEQNFKQWSGQMTKKAQHLGIDSESTLWLLRRHGKRVSEIFQDIEQDRALSARITASVPLIVADLMFCLKHEAVFHLEDLLRRRLPLLILYRMSKAELTQYAQICAKTLNWDQATLDREIEFCASTWLCR